MSEKGTERGRETIRKTARSACVYVRVGVASIFTLLSNTDVSKIHLPFLHTGTVPVFKYATLKIFVECRSSIIELLCNFRLAQLRHLLVPTFAPTATSAPVTPTFAPSAPSTPALAILPTSSTIPTATSA